MLKFNPLNNNLYSRFIKIYFGNNSMGGNSERVMQWIRKKNNVYLQQRFSALGGYPYLQSNCGANKQRDKQTNIEIKESRKGEERDRG